MNETTTGEILKTLTQALNDLLKENVAPGQHASAIYNTAEFYRREIKKITKCYYYEDGK